MSRLEPPRPIRSGALSACVWSLGSSYIKGMNREKFRAGEPIMLHLGSAKVQKIPQPSWLRDRGWVHCWSQERWVTLAAIADAAIGQLVARVALGCRCLLHFVGAAKKGTGLRGLSGLEAGDGGLVSSAAINQLHGSDSKWGVFVSDMLIISHLP